MISAPYAFRRLAGVVAFAAVVLGMSGSVSAQTVTTVAGGNGSGGAANQLDYSLGVAVDEDGNVYFVEHHYTRVKRWAPGASEGTTVAGGHGEGSAANQLDGPVGVAVDGGMLYIADAENFRIQKWAPGDSVGTTVAGGHGRGGAANQLDNPQDVALDGDGNLYIADMGNSRIQKWAPGDSVGTTVAGGNGRGSAANQLNDPRAVALDGAGNLYIAESTNNRVQRWAPGDSVGTTVAGGHGEGSAANQLDLPTGVAVDEDTMYIVDYSNNRIQKWAPGASEGTTVAGGNGRGSAANQLNIPYAVALDGDGNLYISDTGNFRIQKVVLRPVITARAGFSIGEPGESVSVPITLTNTSAASVGGLQFQVIRGATSIQFDSLSSAVPVFTISTNTIGDTTFVLVYSPTGATIAPGSVSLGSLHYTIAPDAPLCTPLALLLNAVEIGDSLANALPDSAINGEIQAGIPGDLDLDRQISILDIVKLVRVIVGKDAEPDSTTCQFFVADFNADDNLNILDVIRQVNVILHITKQIVSPVPTTAVIRLGGAQPSSSGGLVVPVELQSDGLVAGLQATVRFDPSAVSVGTPQLAGSAVGLSLDAKVHDGTLRFVVFGTQPGQGIAAGSSAVLLIPITLRKGTTELPSFDLSDVVVASAQAQRIPVTIGAPVKAAALPTAFSLGVNRPNPFNPATQIAYEVPQQAQITLAVFNVLGQEVVRLVDREQQAGRYMVTWNGRNTQGQGVSSGVYLYRLTSSTGFVESRRMLLLK